MADQVAQSQAIMGIAFVRHMENMPLLSAVCGANQARYCHDKDYEDAKEQEAARTAALSALGCAYNLALGVCVCSHFRPRLPPKT